MELAHFCSTSHVVIVAGKGGVGKTTVTAALAVAAADAGLSVLIVEVEGKSGLAAMFGAPAARLRGDRARAAGSAAGPSRPTPRSSTTSRTTGCGASRSGSVRSGALDVVADRGPGHEGHPRARQGEVARAGASRRPDHRRRARGRPRGHVPPLAARSARRGARRAGPQAGDRRGRAALRPGAVPGAARDAPGGDAGERARRHRVRDRGPRRRRARPGRRERVLPRPAACRASADGGRSGSPTTLGVFVSRTRSRPTSSRAAAFRARAARLQHEQADRLAARLPLPQIAPAVPVHAPTSGRPRSTRSPTRSARRESTAL